MPRGPHTVAAGLRADRHRSKGPRPLILRALCEIGFVSSTTRERCPSAASRIFGILLVLRRLVVFRIILPVIPVIIIPIAHVLTDLVQDDPNHIRHDALQTAEDASAGIAAVDKRFTIIVP